MVAPSHPAPAAPARRLPTLRGRLRWLAAGVGVVTVASVAYALAPGSREPGAARPAVPAGTAPQAAAGHSTPTIAERPANHPGKRARPPAPDRAEVPAPWVIAPATLAHIPTFDAVAAAGGSKREIAITFDDGPSAYTPKVLALLRRYRVHATFFVVGRAVEANPAWTRAIAAAGHEIGNHTWSHAALTQLDAPGLRAEIVGTSDVVAATIGARPALLRPPYGSVNSRTNRAVRGFGLLAVTWNIDPRDYRARSRRAIVRDVLAAAKPGAIVLLHDGGGNRSRTVAALRLIIPRLLQRGYRLVTVSALLNDAPPRERALIARM